MNWLLTFLLNALAVVLADKLLHSIYIDGILPAFLAGAALGIINTFVRPVIVLLTLPFTMLTFGLFIFIINAATFYLASKLVPGFEVYGFGGAFWGALITGFISWVLNLILRER